MMSFSFKALLSDIKRNGLAYGLFAVTAATLLLSCFVPIHVDDIMADIFSARFGFDGGRNNGIWVLCHNNFNTPLPLSLMPGKVLAWLVAYPLATPLAMRLFGVVSFISWIALMTFMTVKSFSVPSWQSVLSLVIGLTFLGVMPFILVFVRPETLMSLVITFYAMLPFYCRSVKPDNRTRLVLAIVFLLLASWLFASHPKALFFAPLALYSLFLLAGSRTAKTLSCATLLVIVAQATGFWVYRLHCPDSEIIKTHINVLSLQPGQFWDKPAVWLQEFFQNVLISPFYLHNILFSRTYLLNWLPDIPRNELHTICNDILSMLCYTVLLSWLIALLYGFGKLFRRRSLFTPDVIVPFLIVLGFIAITGIEKQPLFYNTTLLWLVGSCLSVIFLFCTSTPLPASVRHAVIVTLAVISFFSQLVLLYTFSILPGLFEHADPNGAMANFRESSVLHYAERAERIRKVAAQCHINPDEPNPHLALDALTYLPFRKAYQPVYVSPAFIDDIPHRLMPFLQQNHSAGLVTQCRTLPANLQHMSHQENGLCCIDKSTIGASGTDK